jgi:hypothetical protein
MEGYGRNWARASHGASAATGAGQAGDSRIRHDEREHPRIRDSLDIREATHSPDGKMACMRAAAVMTVPKGAPITTHLRGYTIRRIDADGQWRCVVDIGTEAPNPPAAPKG